MTLGQRIRAARKGAHLSQVSLAAKIGVAQRTISMWETDKTSPRLADGVSIALATGVELLWLATGLGVGPAPATSEAA